LKVTRETESVNAEQSAFWILSALVEAAVIYYFHYMKYQVLVLGSGPAGFEAARQVARAGNSTALITITPPGGRTTIGSLLPSKGWLHAAHHRQPSGQAGGLSPEQSASIAEEIRAGIAARVAWTHNELEAAGVTILSGTGALVKPGHVKFTPAENPSVTSGAAPVPEQEIEADHIVIATGSEPTFAPGVKPDGGLIIAPRHTKMLAGIPSSLIMVGGGITGVEYAEAFARLGAKVTLLSSREILPRFDREYVGLLQSHLEDCGVSMFTGSRVISVDVAGAAAGASAAAPAANSGAAAAAGAVTARTEDGSAHTASMAFIATGRAADLAFIALGEDDRETLLDRTGSFIETDASGRTRLPGVYACGDAAGPPFTANHALHQARRVAAAITKGPSSAGPPPLLEAIYTDPQLVQIGVVLPRHAMAGSIVEHRRSWNNSMLSFLPTASHLGGDVADRGELKVQVGADGLIQGAVAIGPAAAELMAPLQLAMQHGLSWEALTAEPFGYPTWSEVLSASASS